jgi:hypothetical protein
VRFYLALAKIALRHIQAGSSTEVVSPQVLADGSTVPAQ